MLKQLLWGMALFVLFTACGDSGGPLSADDINAIIALNRNYSDSWTTGDKEKVMAAFSEDAVLVPHQGETAIEGKANIRKYFWPETGNAVKITRFVMQPAEISGQKDLGFVRGTFTMSYSSPTSSVTSSGNYLMLVKPDGKTWHIYRYIWNDKQEE